MIKAHNILSLLFILFLVFQFDIPHQFKQFFKTNFGILSVIISVLLLFSYKDPILSILSIVVGYELLYNLGLPNNLFPSEAKKWSNFNPQHQFEYTLEEQMVAKMTNFKNETDFTGTMFKFKPLLENNHDASPI
jgi:uncharacterized membrane protein YqgA involved in biofilm formation